MAPVISDIFARFIFKDSAVIEWKTDRGADSVVEYGLTTSLGLLESRPDIVGRHSMTLRGLAGCSTYFYLVKSSDEAGVAAQSSIFNFTTRDNPVTVFADDLEADDPAWITDGDDGDPATPAGTNFWHKITDNPALARDTCLPEPPCFANRGRSWYYGRDDSCTYESRVVGTRNFGSLTSPVFSVPADTVGPELSFDFVRQHSPKKAGGEPNFDIALVELLSGAGFGTATELMRLDDTVDTSPVWFGAPPEDLSKWVGQTVKVRFTFDTVDGIKNEGLGWVIDNLQVRGFGTCPDVQRCPDADGDGFWASGCVLSPSAGGGDCNDSDKLINPDAMEKCKNGIDDNCNGTIDEGCKG